MGITVEGGDETNTTYMGLTVEDFGYNDPNVRAVFTVTDGYQTITPITASVTISGNNDSSDYNGEAHTVTGYTAEAEPALFDVDSDIVFTGEASATQTDAGTMHMGLTAEQFSNNNPNFANVAFTIEEDGYQTIRPITATVTIIGNHKSFAYNGEEQTVTGFTATADTPLYIVEDDEEQEVTKYFTFSGTAEAKRTDAGQTGMNLAATQFANTNTNFSTVTFEIEDGYVEITPITATVTITGHTGTFLYDGEEHTVTDYDASYSIDGEETELYGESCFELISTGSDSVSRTEAGISEMKLGPDSFRNISPNFEEVTFEVTDGSITINPAIVITKTLNNVLATEQESFTFNERLT